MSLVTPENVHLRPQWRVTPLGRLIRPMRMRPTRPLGPPLDALSKAVHQSLSRGKLGKQKAKRKKTRAPPTRARRQTIDPLRWGSTHLSGLFLEGGHAPSPLPMSDVVTGGGAGAGTNGESTEIEEVEEILDAAQSPTDDHDDPEMIPHSEQASPRSPSSVLRVESTSATDLAAENARTLQLLNSMFGEANEDWGGPESIDSDMEQAAAAESRTYAAPHASESSHIAIADFEVVPAAQRRADNKSSVERQTQQPSTKLKDLFAPREEEGFSLIGHLDLDSELDLDLDEPAFANNAPATTPIPTSASNPTTTTRSAAAPPPPTPAQQGKGLDATLPFFFPHSSHAHAHARGQDHLRRAVKFGRTEDEDEGQIRARWESVRGELTREWKRRHREAVKSSRRRRGAGGERAE
jgi:hypothetical protein